MQRADFTDFTISFLILLISALAISAPYLAACFQRLFASLSQSLRGATVAARQSSTTRAATSARANRPGWRRMAVGCIALATIAVLICLETRQHRVDIGIATTQFLPAALLMAYGRLLTARTPRKRAIMVVWCIAWFGPLIALLGSWLDGDAVNTVMLAAIAAAIAAAASILEGVPLICSGCVVIIVHLLPFAIALALLPVVALAFAIEQATSLIAIVLLPLLLLHTAFKFLLRCTRRLSNQIEQKTIPILFPAERHHTERDHNLL